MPSYGRIFFLGIALTCLTIRLVLKDLILEIILPEYEIEILDLPMCTEEDVSTSEQSDLLVRNNDVSSDSAVKKFKKHGVAMIEDILSPEVSSELRSYILRENNNPSRANPIIIKPKKRKHLTFGVHENIIVTQAVHQILSSQPLRVVLAKHLGNKQGLDGIALMELASISSYFGSEGQRFHKDANPSDRSANMISVFVNLQDTELIQGPTAFCAGTQRCELEENDDCESKWNMTISANTKAGTAAVMDTYLYHRGSSNGLEPDEDRNDTARVMFYMSFATAPTAVPMKGQRDASKLPPQGSTFALRRDMWGQTAPEVWRKSAPTSYETQQTMAAAANTDASFSTAARILRWNIQNRLKSWVTSVTGYQWIASKHRGWTLPEITLVHWSDDEDIALDIVDRCTFYAFFFFILYVLMIEREIGDLRNEVDRKKGEQESRTSTKLSGKKYV